MGLLDLVEQDHGVGPTPHGLGELAALLVADVPGRGTHEARHGVLLGVLGHVDAHDGALVVEEELGQGLGQLGLAHARGAQEEEGAGGAVGVGDAGPRAAHRVGHGGHGGLLPDEALTDDVLHGQELLGLSLEELAHGDAGPGAHDLGDLGGADLLGDHGLAGGLLGGVVGGLGLADLALQGGHVAVAQAAGLLEVALALGQVGAGAHLVQGGAQLTDLVVAGLLGLPAGVERGQLLGGVGQLGAQALEALDVSRVGLGDVLDGLIQVGLLHAHAVHATAQLVDLDGAGVELHAQPGGGLIDQVDGLIRQLATGDVAVGEGRGRHEGSVGDGHLVVGLVLGGDPAQDGHGVLDTGLTDEDLLEAALQGGVLLDVLAVLVQGGGTHHAQLTAGQHGLEHVAGVHGALGAAAGADDGVQLVDEGDDLAVGVLDLLEDGLEALLELTAVLGAGHHPGQVQGDEALAAQGLGDVAGDDALGQALDDGGLAHAGLTDEDGVVLGAPGQDLHDAADLGVAADDRVEAALAGGLSEVGAVLLEGLVGALGVGGGDAGGAADLGQGLDEGLRGGAGVGQDAGHGGGGAGGVALGQADEQVLGGDVLVRQLLGDRRGGLQGGQQGARGLRLGHGGARGGGQLGEDAARGGADGLAGRRVGADRGQESGGDAVGLGEELNEQVRGLDLGVAGRGGGLHRPGDRLLRLGGVVGVHADLLQEVVTCCVFWSPQPSQS